MRTLRFCLVTTFYPPYHFGGDAIFVYRLASALVARGHEVTVVHSEDAYRLQHPEDPVGGPPALDGVTVHRLTSRIPMSRALAAHQSGRPAAYRRQLESILVDGDHDVIHFHNTSLMGGPGVLRMGDALKLYTTHEYWLVCPTHVLFAFDREACTRKRCLRCTLHAGRPPQLWRHTGLLRECAAHVDRFLMPSRFAMERHREDGLDLPMTVLPNFVPNPPEAEASGGPDTEAPYFLFVGRLEKLKGVQDLIRIFRDYRAARLVIVGAGNFEAELRSAAAGLEHVEFKGYVAPDEIAPLYRGAIAVLVPSLCYEVFPLIPAEAFTHGTPVIARRIGALEEVVEESGGGVTFDTLDECRSAMEALRADRDRRDALGARGRSVALERWTTEAHMDRYLGLVREMLEEKGRAGRGPTSGSKPGGSR